MFSTTPSVCSNCRIAAWELAIQHPPVGNDHDGVEDPAVVRVMEGGQLMSQPGDSKSLAAPRRVLHQLTLARAPLAGVAHQPPHAVQLLVAGENQVTLARLPAPGRLPPQPRG